MCHTCIAAINIQHQSGPFVMTDEPTFDIPFYPKFIITLRLTLGVEHPMDLDKYIMTCIYHSIKQNSFTAPANPLCSSCSNFPFELF